MPAESDDHITPLLSVRVWLSLYRLFPIVAERHDATNDDATETVLCHFKAQSTLFGQLAYVIIGFCRSAGTTHPNHKLHPAQYGHMSSAVWGKTGVHYATICLHPELMVQTFFALA